jgi:peptide-methionine (S)-S-oxide reductase
MMVMGQTVRKTRKAQDSARKSEAQSAPADSKKDAGSETSKDSANEQGKSGDKSTTPKVNKIEKATFGGGCFWCMEAVFERIPGVKSVVSGYSGGTVPNPTYEMVCTGLTGHAEVIQIEYDPAVLPFSKLLTFFWSAHDPTTLNSQGPDYGTQYRSIILYHSEEQKEEALKQYKELMAHRGRRSPIVTELVPFKAFYPADDYHQDYYRNHPDADYSQMYIEPKVRKLKQKLKAGH